jgi:7-carboxy-7-deazaguanine synthase
MESHNRWANLPMLRPTDVVKFVIADRRDYLYARKALSRAPRPTAVFQPVWGTDAGRLADWVLADHLDVRVMVQEHKVLWGDVRGK